jgi:L-seryl-tRNA(Ser) seleniumtransferase
MSREHLRSLPSIERLLACPAAARWSTRLGRDRVRDLLREILDELRQPVASSQWPVASSHSLAGNQSSAPPNGKPTTDVIIEEIERRLDARAAASAQPSLRRVINATGVILHTNLGRAPLAAQAVAAIAEVASHYTNLEYDLSKGERGARESHCHQLLARLAGSQAAIVANNNAAAVMLVLNTLAEGGEVIVSRGELIEIGGSFRIPDVMTKSGARLREVGTTNRTRIEDYAQAINDHTRLILRVHPSNYRIVGFTERPTVAAIAELAERAGLPSFEDLGSGCLVDLAPYGIKDEPVVAHSLRAGISVVSFSGDKMLGGPQAGIIAGKPDIIERVRRNPLMRALRVDKLTYAALEATLRLYERGGAETEVPVIRAMATGYDQLAERAERLRARLAQQAREQFKISLEDGHSIIGGGSAPEVQLPTVLIALEDERLSAAAIAAILRGHRVPIIARTERDRVLIDLRTVAPDEEAILLEALVGLAQPAPNSAASVEG